MSLSAQRTDDDSLLHPSRNRTMTPPLLLELELELLLLLPPIATVEADDGRPLLMFVQRPRAAHVAEGPARSSLFCRCNGRRKSGESGMRG